MEAKTKKSLLWIIVAVVMAIVLLVIYVAIAKPQFWRMMRDDIPHYKWLNYGQYDYLYQTFGLTRQDGENTYSYNADFYVEDIYEGGYTYHDLQTKKIETKEFEILQPRVVEYLDMVKEYVGTRVRFTTDSIEMSNKKVKIPYKAFTNTTEENRSFAVDLSESELSEVPFAIKEIHIAIEIHSHMKLLKMTIRKNMRLADGESYKVSYILCFVEKGVNIQLW